MTGPPWRVPLSTVDADVRGALAAFVGRLGKRTGWRWRLLWVGRRTEHWRASLVTGNGLRVNPRYRPDKRRWELDGVAGQLRKRIVKRTGVDPVEAGRKAWRTTQHRAFTQYSPSRAPAASTQAGCSWTTGLR